MGRLALVILDGLGIGQAPDTDKFGDTGSDTLGNVARMVGGFDLPYLEKVGFGCCRPLEGMSCTEPLAAYGVAQPLSQGKDSTTGHWEICGVTVRTAFPTYPNGFPAHLLDEFSAATGRGTMGNKAASGTAIIDELGSAHMESGDWIIYTSADSVFQIAAHEEVVPLAELYDASLKAREILVGVHRVSRVIARPFVGEPGSFRRTNSRKDFSVEPDRETLLDVLEKKGIERVGVGKVDDIFAGRGISSVHTATNQEAYDLIGKALETLDSGLIFANVIEFDQSWGHRNDVEGFHRGLQELDSELPRLVNLLREDDVMILTADHGNDPTLNSTDHSRESVPILVLGPRIKPRSIGVRNTFADIGATVAEFFGVQLEEGSSFLREIFE